MKITNADVIGRWRDSQDLTLSRMNNISALVLCVNKLLDLAREAGIRLKVNKSTGTLVSGTRYGGFRPQACSEGAPKSAHKEGKAVDIYDPDEALDTWLSDEILLKCNLYREHPDKTEGWCHLSIRRPASGHRTFWP